MDRNDKIERKAATPKQDLEGEGNKTADRHYRQEAEKFAHSGKVEGAAKDAERALEEEDEELEHAAALGRKHSAGDLKSDLRGKKS